MVKKRTGKYSQYKRKSNRFQAIRINTNLALLTLADTTVLLAAVTALSQDAWVHSCDLTWAIRGLTAGQGPIRVGITTNALTVGQIGEALDASPASESDIVARERGSRPVRNAGQFSGVATEEVLFDGRLRRIKCKFALANSLELAMWARNESGAPLTTGAVIEVSGNAYISWR